MHLIFSGSVLLFAGQHDVHSIFMVQKCIVSDKIRGNHRLKGYIYNIRLGKTV